MRESAEAHLVVIIESSLILIISSDYLLLCYITSNQWQLIKHVTSNNSFEVGWEMLQQTPMSLN